MTLGPRTVNYGYADGFGRRTSVQDPSGEQVHREYDARNRAVRTIDMVTSDTTHFEPQR